MRPSASNSRAAQRLAKPARRITSGHAIVRRDVEQTHRCEVEGPSSARCSGVVPQLRHRLGAPDRGVADHGSKTGVGVRGILSGVSGPQRFLAVGTIGGDVAGRACGGAGSALVGQQCHRLAHGRSHL